ncbi:hypothetical protein NMG60_11021602 [Bertholletia excelsa]
MDRLTSKPFGLHRVSKHGACRSQKCIVSPPKMTYPVRERIRYLPKLLCP